MAGSTGGIGECHELESLVFDLLTREEPDSRLDATIHALLAAEPYGQGVQIPRHTEDLASAIAAARGRGLIVASGTFGERSWASVWLPASRGHAPILMYALSEARAAWAAVAEAQRILQSDPPRLGGPK